MHVTLAEPIACYRALIGAPGLSLDIDLMFLVNARTKRMCTHTNFRVLAFSPLASASDASRAPHQKVATSSSVDIWLLKKHDIDSQVVPTAYM